MQEMSVPPLGQKGPLEKEMAAHSWVIPWTEEPDSLQSMWPHIAGHNLVTKIQEQRGRVRRAGTGQAAREVISSH